MAPAVLIELPHEILLHILSFLDIPDLASLSEISEFLAILAADPLLHQTRLRVIAPSRVAHSLFGKSPGGIPIRPTVGELIHRGVMRGLQIERRWRTGTYFHSPHAVRQYENGLRLQRRHAGLIISSHLRRRAVAPHTTLKSLHHSHVFPDIESSSLSISRTLLPVVRQLKWSLQKDKMAQMVRGGSCGPTSVGGAGAWIELKGQAIVRDSERVRLALCPNVKKFIKIYETLGKR
ncbi:hypothetical protein BJ138DRAFT_1139794 [Hygrophoropsis aurantiaca]|uniref:Uncharacterized protein n=1 Tax=Hygrophoropsis aurantiaca TaxID=72124 RepID=A0ACB8AT05_9AGAM|nr:hypothetical protein BJ138DRAFT_1139794 [Hygrophoropsis aurantiaca]